MAKRQRCFMEIEVGGVAMGKITMELFNEKCPRTCENFRALCTGEKGMGKTTGKPLHYLSSIFHRVVNGFMIQGGDFSAGNGTGGESIYEGVYPDEDLTTKHDVPFLLSMANRGKDTNGSQFFVTTNVAPHLDGIHVVFGQIKTGHDIVKYIEGLPVDRMCRPMQDVKITRCGELVLKNKAKAAKKKAKRRKSYESSSDTDSSESDEETLPVKSPRKPASQEVEKIVESVTKKTSEDGEIDDLDTNPLVTLSKIDPADIPAIPTNRFLLRGGTEAEKSQSSGAGNNQKSNSSYSSNQRRQNRYGMVTKSGRHIKGRGKFRFRTPSPTDDRSRDRSRSVTPPHWRQAQRHTIKLSEYKKLEIERTIREKEASSRALQKFKPNGTENGSSKDLKDNTSNERRDNILDRDNKEKTKSGEGSQLKPSVELIFVKGKESGEPFESSKPEERREPQQLRKPSEREDNRESQKSSKPEVNEESNQASKRVESTAPKVPSSKPEEEMVSGQALDLNALDYEVTEYEQAESEHSNGNEMEAERHADSKDDAENDDVTCAPVSNEDATEQVTEVKTSPPTEKLTCPFGLAKEDTKVAESSKKDLAATVPAGSSSRQSSKRSHSRSQRTPRESSSSDKRRHPERKSSRHGDDRKQDRYDSRHSRHRRSPAKHSNGASAAKHSSGGRRKSSSSSGVSPRHRRRTDRSSR